jgi:hypothetical protein
MRTPFPTRLAALTWCLLMAPVTHAADTQAIEDTCRKEAAEDGISSKEMDDYMEDCMSESMQYLDDADPLSEGDPRSRRLGDEEPGPEGDQEPAPTD